MTTPAPPPLFSVVINTYNREQSLEQTLEGLRYLDYPRTEVVVVNGPSTDGTESLLEAWKDRVKIARCAERNLSVSRNVGICAAAGEFVAFIDDDAVPEPEWLDQLLAGYDSPMIGATGGIVYDHTGYTFQYQYSTATRLGNANWNLTEPAERLCYPGTFEFPYLQGTNTSFRRSALLDIGGFDEEYEYYLDETDVCLRLIDAGYVVRQLPDAFVHHKFAPSDVRDTNRVTRYRYPVIKNKIYFSLRNAQAHRTLPEILEDNARFVASQHADVDFHVQGGRLTALDKEQLGRDADAAWRRALERGMGGERELITPEKLGRHAQPAHALPILRPAGERMTICFLSQDYPPTHAGGIGRFTFDLANALARLGHNVHVLTRGAGHHRVDFERGVWVHRLVVGERPMPAEAKALGVPAHIWNHAATMRDEVARIATHRRVDVVEAPVWDAEGIALLLDGRFPLVTSLQTTLRIALESHPEWARDEAFMRDFGAPMLAIEKLLFERSAGIHSISRAIAERIAADYGVSFDGPRLGLVPLGLDDRSLEPAVPAGDGVRLLFVGRLEKRKGIGELLEVAPRLLERHPGLALTLVGDDTIPNERGRTYREEFLERHAGRDFLARVRFAGKVPEASLYDHYRDCDIFTSPSHYESFGLIFVEAMMFAKPVVGCDAGGMPEVIEEGRCGLLARPGDAQSLFDCLDRLAGDAALRGRFGERARACYEERFTAARMGRLAEEFYLGMVR